MDNYQGLLMGAPDLNVLEKETLDFTSKITGEGLLFSENKEILLYINEELKTHLNPKQREEIILDKILPTMPSRPWNIDDYNTVNEVLQPYLKGLVEAIREKYNEDAAYNLFREVFSNLAKDTRKYGSWWRATFMEGEDFNKNKINREIYATFMLINERCNKITIDFSPTQRDKKRVLNSVFVPQLKKFTLLLLRIFEISYLLNKDNPTEALVRTEYLRDERYEADFYEISNF